MKKINIKLSSDEFELLGIPMTTSMQKRITENEIDQVKQFRLTKGRVKRRSQEEMLTPASQMSAYTTDGKLMSIDEYCLCYGIDRSSVKSFKLVSHSSIPYYNITSSNIELVSDFTLEDIKEIVSGIKFDKKEILSQNKGSNEILRVILTDVHIGMETDSKGYGMFSEVWNEEELFKRLDLILDECHRIKRDFKEVHIINLGDFCDGWDGKTTRGGHNLPQNMSNRKAFDVGVRFQIELYNRLSNLLECPVVAYNVCNDNHSSDFGFIVNETARMVCEKSNPNITVNNLQRFMSHYEFGDHTFILCHGKDESHMKFGLKPKLDAVVKDKIMQYIKHYKINSEFITFEKGDSHQQLLDSTSSNEFEYFNYRAFSPASSWVNHNFGKSSSGFTLMTVRSDKKSKGIEAIEF